MAKEVVKLGGRLKDYWVTQGLEVHAVSAELLNAAGRRLAMSLPSEYVTLLTSSGLPSNDCVCPAEFCFWTPANLRSVKRVLHEADYQMSVACDAVVIADYMEESWWYVLWASGPYTGLISLVVGNIRCLDDINPRWELTQFVELFLSDTEQLFPSITTD